MKTGAFLIMCCGVFMALIFEMSLVGNSALAQDEVYRIGVLMSGD